jgi:tellurite resistance protein
MLERGTPENGPRELIARLAAAVMVADGHVTQSEIAAVDHLRDLGLGPLGPAVEHEMQRATRVPIDAAAAAAELAEIVPRAGDVIVAALADIAASDGELSPRELAVLSTVCAVLGVDDLEAAHILRSAASAYGATVASGRPRDAEHPISSPSPSGSAAMQAPHGPDQSAPIRGVPEREAPLAALGLSPGASAEELDTAYAGLVRRFNPAAVIELGPEFAVLAVQKLHAITGTYLAAREALTGEALAH